MCGIKCTLAIFLFFPHNWIFRYALYTQTDTASVHNVYTSRMYHVQYTVYKIAKSWLFALSAVSHSCDTLIFSHSTRKKKREKVFLLIFMKHSVDENDIHVCVYEKNVVWVFVFASTWFLLIRELEFKKGRFSSNCVFVYAWKDRCALCDRTNRYGKYALILWGHCVG